MTDRQFNLIVRENLRAASEHVRREHAGRWRHCGDALCRDAQNFVPPIQSLAAGSGVSHAAAQGALALLANLEGEVLTN